jgi:hypothetical protein
MAGRQPPLHKSATDAAITSAHPTLRVYTQAAKDNTRAIIVEGLIRQGARKRADVAIQSANIDSIMNSGSLIKSAAKPVAN